MQKSGNTALIIRKSLPLIVGAMLIISVLVVSGYFTPVLAFDGNPLAVRAAFVTTDCYNDADGANDEPGQKDLTKGCIESASREPVHVTWNWDITEGPGNNSADGCALFDTNLNGYADYAVCNSWKNTPPIQDTGFPKLYSCKDTRADRCAGGLAKPITYGSTCKIVSGNSAFPYNDPFAAGDFYPLDTVSECNIALGDVDFPLYPVNLLNVCSFPSSEPNSDPSDCVITSEDEGNLEIHKNVVPDDPTTNWVIDVSGPITFTDTLTGDDTTYNRVVEPGVYTITETAGLNTSSGYASSWVCTNTAEDPAVVVSGTGTTIANLDIEAGSVWDCFFTNEVKADITVTKTDAVTQFPWVKRVGTPYKYTIQVNHVDTTTGVTAYDVSVTDTLDQWLDYISDQVGYTYTVAINGVAIDPLPVCTWTDDNSDGRGGTFSCPDIGDLASTDVATVTFWVVPVDGTPVYNFIENGECTQNPSMQGTTPVDVCNIVSVGTTSPEVSYTNNDDSEPADIGVPLAVDLNWFEVVKERQVVIKLGWETASEMDIAGFNLYRSNTPDKMKRLLTKQMISAQNPGAMSGALYTFRDLKAKPGKTYYYWLEAISLDGSTELFGPESGQLTR